MQLLNFSIIRLTLFLVIGILIGHFFKIDLFLSALTGMILLAIMFVIYLVNKKKIKGNELFGIFALCAFLVLGIITVNVHDHRNWKNHYTNIEGIDSDTTYTLSLEVIEILKPSIYQDKYFVKLIGLNGQKVVGKLLLNINKDSTAGQLKVDDKILTAAKITNIVRPKNPHQFDYSIYLEKKNVFHQSYVSKNQLKIIEVGNGSLKGLASSLREKVNRKLKEHEFSTDQLAIINAILLGQKRDLSKDMYQQYSSAGVIHILAVSGLHVGIILLILQFIFKPLNQFRKGRIVKILLIIFLLWCFALIAGLSPSVVRAVTMFSIVAIGINIKRSNNIYNTLAISMFVILLVNPMFLFEVGFQLSYLAVFAIVWIQPILYRIWTPKQIVTDYFWQIFTVTIAAQIGVAALSIYYFHQFPGLFFISNLVIIPFLGLILSFGIIVIFLSLFDILPPFITKAYGWVIDFLNGFVGWVAQQESFIFKSISISFLMMLLIYILIFSSIRFIQRKTLIRLMPVLLVVISIQILAIYNKSIHSKSITILHKSRNSLIALENLQNLRIHHNLDSINANGITMLDNYLIGENRSDVSFDDLKAVYEIGDKRLLIIDSMSVYKVNFKPDFVLLRNSPKINLNRLIDYLRPEMIIADGSNYTSYVSRWEETCRRKKLPFHATAKKGAFTIGLR